MTKVLLTGGNGFIAAHILDLLLAKGYHVVTTVRSEAKATDIKKTHASAVADGKLDVAIVEDIAAPDAFAELLKSPLAEGLELVQHTASPFHFKWTDAKTELIDPAVGGTTSLLSKLPASVKKVVLTSSFASILSESKLVGGGPVVFSEADWNDVTLEEINKSPATAYRASKTLAEKAAWEIAKSAPWTLSTICPPLVFGPVAPWLADLGHVNTSNERLANLASGKWKGIDKIPDTGVYLWVDVRDVALAHVAAMEKDEAANSRFFTTAGYFSNAEMVEVLRKDFPGLKDDLPAEGTPGGEFPGKDKVYGYDNTRATNVLGINWIPFEKSIVDTVESLQKVGA